LAGAILLGPRLGRFTADGRSIPIPGHNITFTALGVFILWFGWYGFNPGSKLAFQGTEAMDSVLMVAVNTTLAAAAGCCAATLMAWMMFGKPDLTMALNGTLGGLVGITAGCDAFSNHWSIAVGAIGGAIVVVGVVLLDKLRIDDPVGAFPVHGMGGVWGCLALGIIPNAHLESGATSFMIQLIGITAISVWSFVMLFALFSVLKAIGILRVKAEHEQAGLDISEHGMHAYPSDAVSGGSIA
jgi:Amt family ammonium transporter